MAISHGRRKSKGSAAERELIHKFWAVGWAAVRAAGSGSSQFPSPDILVGTIGRKIALEIKVTKDKKKYFTGEEIDNLVYFSEKFGAEAMVAIKFDRKGTYFVPISSLTKTPASYVISLEEAIEKGKNFEELLSLLP